MAIDRLKSSIWVQAQIKLCALQNIPLYVLSKGDPDAGAILLKICDLTGTCRLYTQTRTLAGELAWSRGLGEGPVDEADANAYIARQQSYDPDLWVIEVEDPGGRYVLDGEII